LKTLPARASTRSALRAAIEQHIRGLRAELDAEA
jgi:hypothetical protein